MVGSGSDGGTLGIEEVKEILALVRGYIITCTNITAFGLAIAILE